MNSETSVLIDSKAVSKGRIAGAKTICFFGCIALVAVWILMFVFIINSRLDFPTPAKVKLALHNSYVSSCKNASGYVTVQNYDGKYGLLDSKSVLRLPFEYDEISDISVPGYPFVLKVRQGDKYGLYNSECEELLSVKCESIDFINDETYNKQLQYFDFVKDGRHGAVHCDKGVVIPAQYDQISALDMQKGIVFKLRNDSKVGAANEKGNAILPVDFYDIKRVFTNKKLYLMAFSDKKQLFDINGKQHGEVLGKYFSTDAFIVALDGKYGTDTLSENGTVIDFKYSGVETEELGGKTYLKAYNTETTDFYNESGLLVYADVRHLFDFYTGKYGEKYGAFDGEGNVLLPFEYDEIKSAYKLEDSVIFVVKNEDKYGCVDDSGKKVISLLYDSISYVDRDDYALYFGVSSDGAKKLVSIYDGYDGLTSKTLFDYEGQFVILKANGKMYFRTKDSEYGYELYNYLGNRIISARGAYYSGKFKNIYVSHTPYDCFVAVDEDGDEYKFSVGGNRIGTLYDY